MTIGLVAIVTAANFTAEGLLISNLLKGGGGGGPHTRTSEKPDGPDFFFRSRPWAARSNATDGRSSSTIVDLVAARVVNILNT